MPHTRTFATLALIASAGLAAPARGQLARNGLGRDTVFIIPGSHLDIGFTAPLSVVREQRIQILDQAIQSAEHFPGFTWFEEGGWVVEAWLDKYQGQPSRIAVLRKLVVAGRIGIGATLLSPHAAAFPQGLTLLTTHLDRMQRELGVRPTVAVINDVPALPEALIDALSAAGIKYLLAAPNLTFSPPLPAALVKQPFYWESSKGARLLVYMDADGYGSASANWGLPPECAVQMNRREFSPSLGRDSIIARGVASGLAKRGSALPLMIVQDAFDNWDTQCAQFLPDAVQRANAIRRGGYHLMVSTPEKYFRHLEARFGKQLPVRRGEWGGDWDLLRATEPVWSWRLREAMRGVTPTTPRQTRIALATATDHNVGLGPRWMGGLSADVGMRHVRDVAALYRTAVVGVLGEKGVSAVPAPLTKTVPGAWPASWRAIVGEGKMVARLRAGGPGFLHPLIYDSAAVINTSIEVTADPGRLLVHLRLDRARLEAAMGTGRFGAVIEIRLNSRIDQLAIAPLNSPAAIAGRWLLGAPPETIISPEGVRVSSPTFAVRARGPLVLGWSVVPDQRDPRVSWLQGLAFLDALEGDTDSGKFRRPFPEMYPGEPAIVDYDLELLLEKH